MKKTLKIILLFLILIPACKKDNNNTETIIIGTVVDSETKEPLEGIEIIKYFLNPVWPYTVDTSIATTTDKEGKFALKLDISKDDFEHTIFAASSEGYCANEMDNTFGTINEHNIFFVKKAYLNLHFKNSYPHDSTDFIWIEIYPYHYEWQTVSWNITGMNVDTSKVFALVGNRLYNLHNKIMKNGTWTNSNEDVYLQGGDTVYRYISY